eukprot:256796-Lingulodinium_polyedra.AAC.1
MWCEIIALTLMPGIAIQCNPISYCNAVQRHTMPHAMRKALHCIALQGHGHGIAIIFEWHEQEFQGMDWYEA